jgi:uncharacterized protein
MKEQTIPIKGMHCRSCEILLTEELSELPGVSKAHANLRTKTATIAGDFLPSNASVEQAVKAAGYEIGYDQQPLLSRDKRVYKDMAIGLAVVTVLFLLFTQLGLGNIANVNMSGASIGLMAVMVGLTAGFSTCMALIGGLVLGVSARFAEKHPTATSLQKFRPHLFFNLGRIGSFVILGGLIGALGAAFQLKGGLLGFLTLAVGAVMVVLGLQLTELFPRLKSSLTLPSKLGQAIGIRKRAEREYSHTNVFWLGAATFFLPCGFTQAMQLFAVSTGNALSGALVMGLFALGTAPGLLSIGGLTSVVKGAFAKRFFRVVGVAVIAMAMINLGSGYNLLGLGNLFTSSPASIAKQDSSPGTVLATTYRLSSDIAPSTFTTKVGQKTTLEVDVKDSGQGCMSTIMIPGLDDQPQFLQGGKKLTLTFTPTKPGTYQITCAMGVPRGSITVEA